MDKTHWLYRNDIDIKVKELSDAGNTAYRIHKTLIQNGVKVSIQTVYRRVWELQKKEVDV
jgi:Fe2+ or Zn2+ uptake regulation protein